MDRKQKLFLKKKEKNLQAITLHKKINVKAFYYTTIHQGFTQYKGQLLCSNNVERFFWVTGFLTEMLPYNNDSVPHC